MKVKQQPVIGAWYVNSNCQFLRVWAMVLDHGRPSRVVLSYLSGARQSVTLEAWHELDLRRYPQKKQKQGVPSMA